MKNINIRRIIYRAKRDWLTLNNGVIIIAAMIACGWIWGSLDVMQRNYKLQKELDDKKKEQIVAQLDYESEKLKQRYYQTDEYKELAAREKLGLGLPGESVLILPANSEAAKNADKQISSSVASGEVEKSKFVQWMDFLFGGSSQNISK